ncbi:MAG TPA: ABC transporter permease [Thermoanaerobaculia bacterium]|nr:ABC transporter permease [Thermoanaerobaculia bacterium]
MNIPEVIRIAAQALRTHKLRSFLTLLGVIIGVMTVVAVVSVISGLNSYVSDQVFQLNPDVYIVTQFGIITSREEFLEAVRRKRIEIDDVRAIERRCTSCGMVGTSASTRMPVKYGNKRLSGVLIFGASSNMAELNNLDIEAGRFYTPTEEYHSAPVVVIGSDVREELFPRLDPIGRTISVGGKPRRVIGLLRKQGSVLGQSQDNQLYMPLSTFRKAFGARRSLDVFIRPSGGMAGLSASQDEVRVILRNRRHTPFRADDPFSMVTAEALQKVWRNISAGAFALMVFISGISLVVGGIVITNIMLVSVIERTREIGIRRALGARQRDIQMQFLTEAIMLALIGGVIGVLLGVMISKGISTAFPLPTQIRPSLIVAALGIAIVTGVGAGFFPARKAAKLPPIEALRYE